MSDSRYDRGFEARQDPRYDARYDPRAREADKPKPFSDLPPPPPDVLPGGEQYDWYARGLELLGSGEAGSALQLLQAAASAEPESRAVREGVARAQFDLGMYEEAREGFAWIISVDPSDDYAQFGLGLALTQLGDLAGAVEHLAYAAELRPDVQHYGLALRGARAALTASRR